MGSSHHHHHHSSGLVPRGSHMASMTGGQQMGRGSEFSSTSSSSASTAGGGVDPRGGGGVGVGALGGGAGGGSLLPSLLMQGYGPQSIEEKQRLYMLLRSLNFNGETAPPSISEPYTPTAQSFGGGNSLEGFYSPELRGELGAGLLDLHAMDDTELLSEDVASEPFEPSPFIPKEMDEDDLEHHHHHH